MTDNVVRAPDGSYAVITSAPPSVALWIIPDYVVIPLILIALRFQSKYGNSKAALGSGEVLSRRRRRTFISSFHSLFILPSLALLLDAAHAAGAASLPLTSALYGSSDPPGSLSNVNQRKLT